MEHARIIASIKSSITFWQRDCSKGISAVVQGRTLMFVPAIFARASVDLKGKNMKRHFGWLLAPTFLGLFLLTNQPVYPQGKHPRKHSQIAKHGQKVVEIEANIPQWTSFRANSQNTGQGGGKGAKGKLLWEFTLDRIAPSTPVLSLDGKLVFIGCANGFFYGISTRTGKVVHRYSAEESRILYNSAAVGKNGLIYFGSEDPIFYAYDIQTAKLRWTFKMSCGVRASPTIDEDGTVYIGSLDGNVYALHGETGKLKWKYHTQGDFQSSVAIGSNGLIYVGCRDSNVYAFDSKTGLPKWTYLTGYALSSSPALSPEGILYIGGEDHFLYALDSNTGDLIWKQEKDFVITSSAAIGKNGLVYWNCGPQLLALEAKTGKVRWKFTNKETIGYMKGSPSIGSDGTVYSGAGDGYFYAFNGATGKQKWRVSIANIIESSPSIDKNGIVYVVTQGPFGVIAIR